MMKFWRKLIILFILELAAAHYFEPFNVTYDHRSLLIAGHRRILISAGIHYPRSTPEMWPHVIAKAKEGGAQVIETYTFWNAHEPLKGQYNFQGRYDLVKFVKLVGSSGLFLFLRIGPYVCAEWNFGGFPVWLRDIPGIEFRTDNAPFKEEMQQYVTKIVNLMLEEKLFSWQGGPIILLQIENEYGDFEESYGKKGKNYIQWAAKMAVELGAGVPWVMCKQTDAPEFIIDTCNGYYCDGFKPNSKKKPIFWTENWDGWYTTWGGRLPHRPVEDLAFAVARFFQRGGSLQNYYMYFGGTNFGRTSGGPFYITSYDYDAPIDEYGLLSQPKWGHLKDLHLAIRLCEAALVAVDSPQYVMLGPQQEAHVYQQRGIGGNYSRCSAFLANINEHNVASVKFRGHVYSLPPWSVSILPDCKNVAYNTAKVGAQTSIKEIQSNLHHPSSASQHVLLFRNGPSLISKSWMRLDESVGVWINGSFAVHGILEHLNVTRDSSDYLWHFTRIYISADDISFWKRSGVSPALTIDSMRDVVHIFVNGQLAGSGVGRWVQVFQPVQLLEGYNDVVLLSLTVGLQNYGAFLEKDGGGFRGQIKLTGLSNGDMNLSGSSWIYQVGLKGEIQEIYTLEGTKKASWLDLTVDAVEHPLSWYKTYFDAPDGMEPVALDLRSMGKGQAWVNGHHIGRYWTLSAPEDGCQSTCDYRGKYDSDKCTTNCGKPTQVRYHVPRSWLKESNNLLVIFEEIGGNPFEISIKSHTTHIICAEVSESHYPPLSKWLTSDSIDGNIFINDTTPEMHLHCEPGYAISTAFASYGIPHGRCQRYSIGSCHSSNSFNVVSELCEGKQECTIGVSNAVFGGDPCRGSVKTLAVEAKCLSSKDSEPSFVDVL
ncbi:beta-galactosidase 9 isoform X2 [Silene latifolia]|uniref:beta-galactosidase 9 isoform X2 n=2 Tax=Silene latifolia TaxID=37657 RepID=UPI003D770C13